MEILEFVLKHKISERNFDQTNWYYKSDSGIVSWWKTIKMLALLLLSLTVALTSPMHMKPPINRAVCDTPSFIISEETGWCYRPGSQVMRGPWGQMESH